MWISERYLRQGKCEMKRLGFFPILWDWGEMSHFGLFFSHLNLGWKAWHIFSLKIKESSTCGHELKDLVKGEKGIYSLLLLISSMSQAIHYIVMTIAKKYMFSMKFMSFHGLYNTDSGYCQHEHSKNNQHVVRDLRIQKKVIVSSFRRHKVI